MTSAPQFQRTVLRQQLELSNYCFVRCERSQQRAHLVTVLRRLYPSAALSMARLPARNPAAWYCDLTRRILGQLSLPARNVDLWWAKRYQHPHCQRFFIALRELLLARLQCDRVVIFLDDLQAMVRLPFETYFLDVVRSAYDCRILQPDLRRLTFVLLGSCWPAKVVGPLSSPYNVGPHIELDDDGTATVLTGIGGDLI